MGFVRVEVQYPWIRPAREVDEVTEQFRTGFEAFVPEALQCAYDYVGHDERVETIWIVGDRDGDWTMGNVYYRVAGVPAEPMKMSNVIPGFDDSQGHWEELRPATRGIGRLLAGGDRSQNPTRAVIRYDVVAQAMNADFSYEPLTRGPDDTLSEVADAWFERLRSTGNNSASD